MRGNASVLAGTEKVEQCSATEKVMATRGVVLDCGPLRHVPTKKASATSSWTEHHQAPDRLALGRTHERRRAAPSSRPRFGRRKRARKKSACGQPDSKPKRRSRERHCTTRSSPKASTSLTLSCGAPTASRCCAAGGLQRHAHGETGFVLPPIERESEPQEVGSKINDLPEAVARLPWHLRATAFEEMLDGCSTHGHLDISRGAVPPLFARLNTASHFGRNA